MGKLYRFRGGRRLKGLGEFDSRQRIRFWPEQRRSPLRRFAVGARPFVLLALLVGLWPALDPALVEPPSFLATEPEIVAASFTRCGRGRGHACVVDGDTFKLGDRSIRIIGIDAPEVRAQCAQEARLAEQATARLQALLNQGPVELVGRIDQTRDRYGRDLRAVRRTLPDGSIQSIAAEMREAGLARRYLGGLRSGWC